MGEQLLDFYRNKIPKHYKYAFFSTLVLGLLIHIYKFTNTLPNHDSVYNFYSAQNVVGSGRWALSLACGLSSYYDLPWANGLMSIIFIAFTVVVIVAVFEINNPVVITLAAGILASAPATTETFFFLFTADGYMIAMLLAAVAVYCSRIGERRKVYLFLSGLCVCVSCGIYQAYVSFALVLAVCHFVYEVLNNKYELKEYLCWIRNQIVIYGAALASYYVIWKLCLYFQNTAANSYQGISEVGKISVQLLINGLKNSIRTSILYFLQWDVLEHGFSLYSILNLVFWGMFVAVLVTAIVKSGLIHRKIELFLLMLSLAAIFPFACIWHFTSDSVGYRAMMLQSLSLLFILMALLFEQWSKMLWKNIACVLLVVIIFNNALMANISYYYMNLCYERTYAEAVEMMSRYYDLEAEQELEKIAVIGSRIYDVQFDNVDPVTGKGTASGRIKILSGLLEETLLFNQDQIVLFLKNVFGLELEAVSKAELDVLQEKEDVQAMEYWPDSDSMKVIDGTLIIKLGEEVEY